MYIIILARNNTLAYPSTLRETYAYFIRKISFYLFFEILFYFFSRFSMMGCARVKKEIKFKWCPTRVIIFLFRLFYGCVYYSVWLCVCLFACACVHIKRAIKTQNKKTKMKKRHETKPNRKRNVRGRRRLVVVWLCGSQSSFIFSSPPFLLFEKERKKWNVQ